MGFEIWGSDSGEYYSIIRTMTDNGSVPENYEGWGFAYPYFYGMESISTSVSMVSGLNALNIMVFVVPALSAFLVLLIFFIVKNLTGDVRIALLSSLFVAVSPPGVFTTSHPMPGAIGDFLGLLVITLFLSVKKKPVKDFERMTLLFLAISALMVTHHMSAYFIFITLGMFTLSRELLKRTDPAELERDMSVLYFMLGFMVIYWLIIVEPFREKIADGTFGISGFVLAVLAFAGLTALFIGLSRLNRSVSWYYVPAYPDFGKVKKLLLAAGILSISMITLLVTVQVPGTQVNLGGIFFLTSLPLVVLIIFSAAGPGFARFYSGGVFLLSWLGAILISMIIMTMTGNVVLLPYRHLQYLFEPLLILSAIGIFEIFRNSAIDKNFGNKMKTAGVIILLSLSVGSFAYPPKEALGNFQEGTVWEEIDGVNWVREYQNDFQHGKIATDHRMSSMLFGFGGVVGTWDSAYETLHAENYENASKEIKNEKIIGVFMDNEIREGAAMLQWENAEPISEKSQRKFEGLPFVKVMDSGFVQVYVVVNITEISK